MNPQGDCEAVPTPHRDAQPLRIWVTRPRLQAESWLRALQRPGWDPVALPLLQLGPVSDAAPLLRVWQRCVNQPDPSADVATQSSDAPYALMFVSANAVQFFFQSVWTPSAQVTLPINAVWPWAWATGEGTRHALLEVGWPASRICAPEPQSPQHDSEALWMQVAAHLRADAAAQPAAQALQVVLIRGGDEAGRIQGRGWLAERLHDEGVQVTECMAYVRQMRTLTLQERQAVRAASQPCSNSDVKPHSVWLFSSSQSLDALQGNFPDASWVGQPAVVTHARIGQRARALGFAPVLVSAPGLDAVCASIESLA